MSCLYSMFYVTKKGDINSFDIKTFPIDEEVRAMRPHLYKADIHITYEVGRFVNFRQLHAYISECEISYLNCEKFLDRDKCEEILSLLKKINKDNAMEILPPSDQDTKEDYNKQFFNNVDKAIKMFENLLIVLNANKNWYVLYDGIN